MENIEQRVVMNNQISSWNKLESHKVPFWALYSTLICIDDLPKEITSVCEVFADDMWLFSKIENKNLSAIYTNEDLKAMNNLAYQWKTLFNSDPNKQAT